jgi:protein required for attachment to host cells
MKTTWILVANASRAQLYQRGSDSDTLEVIESFVHPESRLRSADLKDDQLGRAITDSGGHTSYSPPTSVEEKEQERFARQIADCLKQGHDAGRCDVLHLFASDHMLGAIRAHLDPQVARKLDRSAAIDLTAFSGRELENRISKQLGS